MNDLMSVNKKDIEIFSVNSIDDTLYKHTHKISLAEVQAAVQKLKVEQGWGQVQYLYLVLVLKYIFIST